MHLKQHLPWWLLFLLFNGMILLLGLLDASIPDLSVVYIVIVNSVLLVIFAVWQYTRGRRYTREVLSMETVEDIDTLPQPVTADQQALHDRLVRVKHSHNQRLDAEAGKTKESLDELTRWIHDMKMPMTTMKLLIDDLEGQEKMKLANEWQRLDGMLNEMLYMKRLPNIRNDLYFETVEIEPLVRRSIQKLRRLCMEKGVGFDIDLEVPEVEADVKWLAFILDQIITNSVKYTHNDDVRVSNGMEDGHLVLAVTDHGRGIRNEDVPRIFEAGFTSTSNHEDAQSTGMGLYLAQEAADAMNMKIEVDSEYGKGTRIEIIFPEQNTFHRVKTM
ncbi:sensor histidine kinase [Salinicoccus bachuensis]|uniref:histidine kinase n=1 Tax=Salinicoccus bachuensis TaxID=3136731 RepID=A0ABZ3CHD9_9STAP